MIVIDPRISGDGYRTVVYMYAMPMPTSPQAHEPTSPRAHAPCARVPAVVVELGELDSGDDPWQGSRWASTAPSQPILAAWPGSLIKLNIGIDLDNLTTCPAMPCPALSCRVHTAVWVGHVVDCPTGERIPGQKDCRWSAAATGRQVEDVPVPCRALPSNRAVQCSTWARREYGLCGQVLPTYFLLFL